MNVNNNSIKNFSNESCPCCKNTKLSCNSLQDNKHLLFCNNCGIFFFAETPTDLELQEYYRTTYSINHKKQLYDMFKKKYDSKFYKNEISNILNYYKIKRNDLTILDFGTGYGFFLKAAKSKGFNVYGIEYDSEIADYNKNEFGIKMITLTDLEKIPDRTFDVIRAFHIIEHLSDPEKILKIFYNKLKYKGIIMISSPSFSPIFTQGDPGKLFDVVYPEHIFYFTHNSWKELLSRIGFDIEINITQFSNMKNLLKLLGINQISEIKESDFFSDKFLTLRKILENEPFFAGTNSFTVARRVKR